MRLKVFPLIIGIGAITVLNTSIPANAQTNPQQFQQGFEEIVYDLNLTRSQQAKLQEIQQQNRSEIGKIMTSTQKEIFQNAIQQGQSRQAAMISLNLSPRQKYQILSIEQFQRRKMQNVLTEEQHQQLR